MNRALQILLVAVLLAATGHAARQAPAQTATYDLLLQGGHVIDPGTGVNAIRDVAITGSKVAAVAAAIAPSAAKQVIDVRGLYVTPGLVDIHTHVYYGYRPDYSYGGGQISLPPDGFTFRAGVTTVVDAGGAGWRTFAHFKEEIIDRSKTRILAFLNIVGEGERPVAEQNLADMDARATALKISQFPDILVGVKTAHYQGPEWDPVDRAVTAGQMANVPVMVDFGRFLPERPFQDLVLKHLRPGDISTHTFNRNVPMLDGTGRILPYLFEAQKRGVIFDVGHGGGSFVFRQAAPAVKQGFIPDSIGTDLHGSSMNAGVKDMLNLMSKFMAMGMSLEDVIARTTLNPAKFIKRPSLGTLAVGAEADVAVLRLREGDFAFIDADRRRLKGARKLEAELTLKGGQVVWDLNGMASVDWDSVPPGSN